MGDGEGVQVLQGVPGARRRRQARHAEGGRQRGRHRGGRGREAQAGGWRGSEEAINSSKFKVLNISSVFFTKIKIVSM